MTKCMKICSNLFSMESHMIVKFWKNRGMHSIAAEITAGQPS